MAFAVSFDELLQAASLAFDRTRPLIPMYIHLVLAALFPIYTGAHASLSRPSSAAEPLRNSKRDEEDQDEDTQKMEGMTPRDAIVFPITAGIVLTGLYFAIKAYGASLINLILGIYFSVIGTFSVAKLINDAWSILASIVFPTYYCDSGKVWQVKDGERRVIGHGVFTGGMSARQSPLGGPFGRLALPDPLLKLAWFARDLVKKKYSVQGYLRELVNFRAVLTGHNVLSMALGVVAISYSLLADKPWWLTNLQGFAFSYGALQLLSPTTFATGTLILAGLFFYDIWAVFFTPLMITVAKNLDVPIKLVFPRPDQPSATPGEPPIRSFSMLGLGDIVLPGIMIGLALRFDLYMFYLKKQLKITNQSGNGTTAVEVVKSPYISVSGGWGERLWTLYPASMRGTSVLPAHLATHFPKPYFTATMIGYVVGLVATLVVMSIFDHGQPALLYLVPGVLTCLWGTALVRCETKEMWHYTEAVTTEADDDVHEKQGDGNTESGEAKSFFSSLWAELVGSSAEDQKDEKIQNKEDGDSKKDGATKSEREDFDPSVVFSFTITHYRRDASKTRNSSTSTDINGSKSWDSSALHNHKQADSISDDAVLVSSADLDGAKDTERPHYRTVAAPPDYAEKRARID